MSQIVENPQPRTRSRQRKNEKSQNVLNLDSENENSTDAMQLEQLRQSIEKVDVTGSTEKNLFNPDKDSDKLKRRKERRRRDREDSKDNHIENELKDPSSHGVENVAFINDEQTKETIGNGDTVPEDKPKPRKKRSKKKESEEEAIQETKNAELSNLPDEKQRERKRRRRKNQASTKDEADNNIEVQLGSEIHRQQSVLEEEEDVKDGLEIPDEGKVLRIIVHRTDRLKTDINVLHPMVRISFVDMSTGTLLVKQNRNRRVVSCNEDTERVPYILQIITQPYEYKFSRCSIPSWKEEFVLNENAKYLTHNSSVVIFFEIIDLINAYTLNKKVINCSDGFKQVAWAFLRPLGERNTQKSIRLQLYECGDSVPNNIAGSLSPSVFYWWHKGYRNPYPSTLYVTLESITLQDPKQPDTILDGMGSITTRSMLPNQMEGGDFGLTQFGETLLDKKSRMKLNNPLTKWARLPGQSCHIPNTFLGNLSKSDSNSGNHTQQSCSIIKFSPNGYYLAVALLLNGDSSVTTNIVIYDLRNNSLGLNSDNPTGKLPGSQPIQSWTNNCHNRIVHCMAWSSDNCSIATGSADGTVKIWPVATSAVSKQPSMATNTETTTTTTTPTEPQNVRQKQSISHPCFVYSVQFYPQSRNLLVSAGYDRVIRLWNLAVTKPELLQTLDGHKGYINAMVFSNEDSGSAKNQLCLYSGDSKGQILVWSCPTSSNLTTTSTPASHTALGCTYNPQQTWTLLDTYTDMEMKDRVIINLIIAPNNRRIFVQTRNDDIRIIDLKIHSTVMKLQNTPLSDEHKLQMCCTPCGSFIFCGGHSSSSDIDGSQVCVWNAQTGDVVVNYNKIPGFGGPNSAWVTTIDYHPTCHIVAMASLDSSALVLYGYVYDKNDYQDQADYGMVQREFETMKMDRLTSVINSLSSVTEGTQSLRRGARSIERRKLDFGYESPEERGAMLRHMQKSSTLEAPPMTLSMTSSPRNMANFTFKPPPSPRARPGSKQHGPMQGAQSLGEVLVLYDYQAQRSDELSLVSGEKVLILHKDGPHWLIGQSADGRQGYLPANYVAGSEDLIPSAEVSLLEENQPIKSTRAKSPTEKSKPKIRLDVPQSQPRSRSKNKRPPKHQRSDEEPLNSTAGDSIDQSEDVTDNQRHHPTNHNQPVQSPEQSEDVRDHQRHNSTNHNQPPMETIQSDQGDTPRRFNSSGRKTRSRNRRQSGE